MDKSAAAHRPKQEKNAPLRLGEFLLKKGTITHDQLRIGLHEHRQTNGRLGKALILLGFLAENDLAKALAQQTGHQFIDLRIKPIDAKATSVIPLSVAKKCIALPIAYEEGKELRLAVADPYDLGSLDEIRKHVPRQTSIIPFVAAESAIHDAIADFERTDTDFDHILNELENTASTVSVWNESWQHPIVRLAETIISDAVREGASDIHLEPENAYIRVRFRIDGVLRQKMALHATHWPPLSHRLKILSGMNIADTRSMQDGNFHMQIGGAEIDFRMAIMPTICGENIVIRILDHRRALLPLKDLGYDARALKQLELLLERPRASF